MSRSEEVAKNGRGPDKEMFLENARRILTDSKKNSLCCFEIGTQYISGLEQDSESMKLQRWRGRRRSEVKLWVELGTISGAAEVPFLTLHPFHHHLRALLTFRNPQKQTPSNYLWARAFSIQLVSPPRSHRKSCKCFGQLWARPTPLAIAIQEEVDFFAKGICRTFCVVFGFSL